MTSDRNRLNVTEEEIAMSLASFGEDPTVERVSLISRIVGLRSYFGGPREEVLKDAVDFVRKELLTPEPEWRIAGKAGSGKDPQTVYFASRRLGGREQFLRTESGALHTWETNDAAIAALPALAEAHLNARLACKRVVNDAGIGFLVRMVHKGDGYGLRDQLVHDADKPMVDIFDASGDLHPLGSSVSRYFLDTLLERPDGGLNLFGGEPDYVWSADNLHGVLTWAQAQVLAHDAKEVDAIAVRELGDPDGMNDERASWAGVALQAFMVRTGTDREDALSDLLCDLMHYCDRNAESFEAELERARGHYDAETQPDVAADPSPGM